MTLSFGRYPQPAFRPKEPTVLTRLDGKRPDGLTLVPWQEGKPVTWDITVGSTLAQSYLHASGHSAAGAVELAVSSSSNSSTTSSTEDKRTAAE